MQDIQQKDLKFAIDDVMRSKKKPPNTESKTARLLLGCLGWGLLHASFVQKIADVVVQDMRALGVEPQQSIIKLQKSGAGGHYPGNSRRDLWCWLKHKVAKLPQAIVIEIPFQKVRALKEFAVEHMKLPIMMPNLLLEGMFRLVPAYFERMLGSGLEVFWSQVFIIVCVSKGPSLRVRGFNRSSSAGPAASEHRICCFNSIAA